MESPFESVTESATKLQQRSAQPLEKEIESLCVKTLATRMTESFPKHFSTLFLPNQSIANCFAVRPLLLPLLLAHARLLAHSRFWRMKRPIRLCNRVWRVRLSSTLRYLERLPDEKDERRAKAQSGPREIFSSTTSLSCNSFDYSRCLIIRSISGNRCRRLEVAQNIMFRSCSTVDPSK